MMKNSLLSLLFIVSAGSLPAQSMYLALDTVKIAGSAAPHLDEIKISSFQVGQTMPATMTATAGLSAGKATFAPVSITTSASALVNAMLNGRAAIGSRFANVEIRSYDASNQVTSKIQLQNVMIAGLKSTAADEAQQSIDLSFEKIRWWAIDPRLGAGLRVVSGWDLTKAIAW